MTNDEARMANEKAMSNDQKKRRIGTPGPWLEARGFFVIAVSSFIRHSDFGVRHFLSGLDSLPAAPP
jgi:hypothetical protein